MKLLFFDLETTGLMHWKNGIHQLSGIIEIDGEIKEYFDLKIQPNPKATIEDDALKVAGITRETFETYIPFNDGYKLFVSIISKYVDKYDKKDKFHLVGYNNASFDNQFLRAFFVQNGDDYFGSWFWSSTIDVMVLAAHRLMHKRHEMKDFKLSTVASQFENIEIDEAMLHDAMYDIQLTQQIYHNL